METKEKKLKSNGSTEGSDNDVHMDVTSCKQDAIKIDGDEVLHPGKIIIDYSKTNIEINNSSADVIFLSVTNTSDEPISVGSHFNFIEANKNLKFDRTIALGMRLVNILEE